MNVLPHYPTIAFLLALTVASAAAQAFPRALPEGQLPEDVRLAALRTLNSYHPWQGVASRDAWAERAQELRRQVLVATGLWPLPSKTPLNSVIHGLVERDDYTVEKVYFESFPGHYVSGNLYRPKGVARGRQVPGILSPHGHWKSGRFHDHGDEKLGKELASGAERFSSGRHPLQARCVQLARMGCVVFHYDMVGYADSFQLHHRTSTMPSGGLFSVAAELRQQNVMGIQTYNSIRALDFIESLPEIDRDRIGVTGASGGGTQTFMLGAVDDRPDLLFPAVMVSTAMQGGCVCENANYLRVDAGNIDIAALAVPRPLGLTGAEDWTVEIETKGKPELQALYGMMGVAERFAVFPYLRFGHNYNAVSRRAMYGFVNKHFQLGHVEPIAERDFVPLSREEMSVWSGEHPAPKGRGAVHEQGLLRWWENDSQTQLAALAARMASDAGASEAFQRIVGGAWQTMVGRTLAEVGAIECTISAKVDLDRCHAMTGLLSATVHGEQVPALFLHPKDDQWNGEVVFVVHSQGKRAAIGGEGSVRQEFLPLVDAGYSVMLADTLLTGEFTKDERAVEAAPINAERGWDRFSGYTYGYNRPLLFRRIHDLLTAIAFVTRHPKWEVKKLHLAGIDEGGAILTLAARSQCGEDPLMGKMIVTLNQARLAHASSIDDPYFTPGAVKYGDVPGLLALCAPAPALVTGETLAALSPAVEAYLARDAGHDLEVRDKIDAAAALAWLGE